LFTHDLFGKPLHTFPDHAVARASLGDALTAISIDHVSRTFGTVRAVDDVSLDIKDGEFFTLLGPSGCGKTTLLRMIAGFADLSAGEIRFGDKRIDTLPPHRRNAGMVFQNYAIFPNLTVGGNVAYGLKARSVAAAEIRERVARALRLVHLDGYDERWPHQLSGGQLQRVAIARCLVIEPEVLLLDEPLSNLDAKLRVEMRAEIRQLQQELKITAIYVTHDQEEALAMSDRVAVMRAGRLEQVARPQDIYRAPATPFVAEFMGTTNRLKGTVTGRDGEALRIRAGRREFYAVGDASDGERISFSLRPETIRLLDTGEVPPPGWRVIEAELGPVEFLGAITRIELDIGDGATLRVASLDLLPDQLARGRLTAAYDPRRITVFRG
jgi:iron(III) transport system ATP-binding protein